MILQVQFRPQPVPTNNLTWLLATLQSTSNQPRCRRGKYGKLHLRGRVRVSYPLRVSTGFLRVRGHLKNSVKSAKIFEDQKAEKFERRNLGNSKSSMCHNRQSLRPAAWHIDGLPLSEMYSSFINPLIDRFVAKFRGQSSVRYTPVTKGMDHLTVSSSLGETNTK